MSLYQLQKFLYVLNRDEGAQQTYRDDSDCLDAATWGQRSFGNRFLERFEADGE